MSLRSNVVDHTRATRTAPWRSFETRPREEVASTAL